MTTVYDELRALLDRVADMEHALRWYAAPANYERPSMEKAANGWLQQAGRPVLDDMGQRARAALGIEVTTSRQSVA